MESHLAYLWFCNSDKVEMGITHLCHDVGGLRTVDAAPSPWETPSPHGVWKAAFQELRLSYFCRAQCLCRPHGGYTSCVHKLGPGGKHTRSEPPRSSGESFRTQHLSAPASSEAMQLHLCRFYCDNWVTKPPPSRK